ADDLGFYLWAGGQDWWSAEGELIFFPAQASIFADWDGSNAPHLAGEVYEPYRRDCQSTLLGYAHSAELIAIDVQRRLTDGFSVRRQVIQAGPARWVVIDSSQDRDNREVRTIWLAGSDLSHVVETPSRRFRLLPPRGDKQLEVTFLGS